MFAKELSWIRAGWKVSLQYKFDFVIGLATTPISLFIYYFLWKAIFAYTGQTVIQDYQFQGLIEYFVLAMMVGFFAWSDVDNWMEYDVRSGEIITQFLKPASLLSGNFLFELGLKIMNLLVNALPLLLIAFLVFSVRFHLGIFTALAMLSVVFASIMYFLISYCIGLSAFWIKKIHGIRRFKRGMILLLSGSLLPLTFYPLWYQKLSTLLPFQYISFVPVSIYQKRYDLGSFSLNNVYVMLLIQAAWIVPLYFLAKFIEKRGFKKFAGEGT